MALTAIPMLEEAARRRVTNPTKENGAPKREGEQRLRTAPRVRGKDMQPRAGDMEAGTREAGAPRGRGAKDGPAEAAGVKMAGRREAGEPRDGPPAGKSPQTGAETGAADGPRDPSKKRPRATLNGPQQRRQDPPPKSAPRRSDHRRKRNTSAKDAASANATQLKLPWQTQLAKSGYAAGASYGAASGKWKP